ncbi:MAG: hypothetical protein LBI79_10985, partial [Nitrososphaerota archaeon]|nr:hypothetical protein [Nitrososphaerota archaeon]
MKNITQKSIAIIFVLALVVGCFAAILQTTTAGPTPVPGEPAWKATYSQSNKVGHPDGQLWNRGNAAGDKIPSNAHSADFPGLYFYWDDKQKDDGILLVCDYVFDLFQDNYVHTGSGIKFGPGENGFVLTAKNSNNYWGYKIAKSTGEIIDNVNGVDIYAYAIPKQFQYIDSKGKEQTESLKNINMVFIDGNYKRGSLMVVANINAQHERITRQPYFYEQTQPYFYEQTQPYFYEQTQPYFYEQTQPY